MKLIRKRPPIDDKIQQWLLNILRVSLAVALIWALATSQLDLIVSAALALIFSFIPSLIEKNYKVALPVEFELMAVLFIYGSLFLGFFFDYYARVWWWDDFLHTSSGVVLGFAGFVTLYTMYYQKKLQSPAWLIAFLSFSVAVTLGVVWEIAEFGADQLFGANSQSGGLRDTMFDLIVDSLGALFVAVPGYFYIKQGRQGLLANFVRDFLNSNPHIKRRITRR